eukprot:366290-Chlamydomonas_euryale.AAC.1
MARKKREAHRGRGEQRIRRQKSEGVWTPCSHTWSRHATWLAATQEQTRTNPAHAHMRTCAWLPHMQCEQCEQGVAQRATFTSKSSSRFDRLPRPRRLRPV